VGLRQAEFRERDFPWECGNRRAERFAASVQLLQDYIEEAGAERCQRANGREAVLHHALLGVRPISPACEGAGEGTCCLGREFRPAGSNRRGV